MHNYSNNINGVNHLASEQNSFIKIHTKMNIVRIILFTILPLSTGSDGKISFVMS